MKKLPTIMLADIKNKAAMVIELVLKAGPHAVTKDGDEMFVIMNLDEYYALIPVNPNPPRQPKMTRIEGVMYREVI